MQPKVKDTPGSQGTLFGGGYRSDASFKGYDADRLNAVRDVVKESIRPASFSQYGFAAHHEVVDTLARSTAPVEHMGARAEPGRYHQGQLQWVTGQASVHGGALGVYRREGYGDGQPTIALKKGTERTETVIHELGHHVSHVVERTAHSAYDTPERQGHEEGFAEAYAKQHYRGRRGDPSMREKGPDAWSMSRWPTYHDNPPQEHYEKQYEFNSAYRQHVPKPPPVTMQPRTPSLPPEHVEGQLPLLDKVHTQTTDWAAYNRGEDPDVHHINWDYTVPQKHQGLHREDMR